MATLNLKDSYRSRVWRVLRKAIEADPVYEQAGIALSFFDGDLEVLSDLDTIMVPVVQFFPTSGPAQWFDEGSSSAGLTVQVEARLTRLDVEDVFNLQEALESSLNTLADETLRSDLVDAEAVTGLVLFSSPLRPASSKPGQDGLFRLTGSFAVEVRRPLLS